MNRCVHKTYIHMYVFQVSCCYGILKHLCACFHVGVSYFWLLPSKKDVKSFHSKSLERLLRNSLATQDHFLLNNNSGCYGESDENNSWLFCHEILSSPSSMQPWRRKRDFVGVYPVVGSSHRPGEGAPNSSPLSLLSLCVCRYLPWKLIDRLPMDTLKNHW